MHCPASGFGSPCLHFQLRFSCIVHLLKQRILVAQVVMPRLHRKPDSCLTLAARAAPEHSQGTGRVAAGRFGGRDAKMARIREQEAKMAAEAAAKLGVPSAATTSVAAGTTAAGTTGRKGSDASDTTSEARVPSSKRRGAGSAAAGDASEGAAAGSGKSGKSSKKESKRRKKAEAAGEGAGEPAAAADAQQQQQGEAQAEGQPAKKQRIVIEPAVAQSGPVYPFVPTPATGEMACLLAGNCLPMFCC